MTAATKALLRPLEPGDIEMAVDRLQALKKRYLEEHGWVYTCDTPGSIWLWKKVYREDIYLCSLELALSIEEALK